MTLSAYEQDQWDRLQAAKAEALSKQVGHLLPAGARVRVSSLADAARQIPAAETVGAAYASVVAEFGKIVGGAASHTVSSDSVIKQFQKAGHELTALNSIRDIDLEVIDSVIRLSSIRWGHSGSAFATGFVSGGVITGGQVMLWKGSVHAQGAKHAPGIGVVSTAYAADITAVLAIAARTVASTARYYGFDPQERAEQVFMMSVIGLGLATGATAKTAAYAELSQLTQLLFRDAAWAKLNEKVLTKLAQQFASKFALSLTKKKFGQLVPLAGVLVGAGLNVALISRVAEVANDAYRERFLIEKSGGTLTPVTRTDDPDSTADDRSDIIRSLEDEGVLPQQESGAPVHPSETQRDSINSSP